MTHTRTQITKLTVSITDFQNVSCSDHSVSLKDIDQMLFSDTFAVLNDQSCLSDYITDYIQI